MLRKTPLSWLLELKDSFVKSNLSFNPAHYLFLAAKNALMNACGSPLAKAAC